MERWWDADPVSIKATTQDGIWIRHDPPPFMLDRMVGWTPVGHDKIARWVRILLDWPEDEWIPEELLVALVGPIEYCRATMMPDELEGRIERAFSIVDDEDLFSLAKTLGLSRRKLPRTTIGQVHGLVRRILVEHTRSRVAERVEYRPQPASPSAPIRSSGRPQVESR